MTTIPKLAALEELKKSPNWVVHKAKVPFDPKTRKAAHPEGCDPEKCADPASTWGTYEQALQAYNQNRGWYQGIGREFAKQEQITGIDLDKCRDEEGNLTTWAMSVISRLNSYTEVSPSGRGIHIFVHGNIPGNLDASDDDGDNHIEMYDCTRYFTWTGKRLEGTPETIEDRQDVLTMLHSETTISRKLAKLEALQKKISTEKREQRQRPVTLPDGDTKYGLAALHEECQNLATVGEGSRNSMLNKVAFRIGQLVGGNQLTRATAERELFIAAERTGLDADEIEKTMGRALDAGEKDPVTPPAPKLKVAKAKRTISTPDDMPEEATDLPQIIIGGQLRDLRDKTMDVLRQAHAVKPQLFAYMGSMGRIGQNEEGRTIIMPLGVPGLKNELTDIADFYRAKENKLTGEIELTNITPPKELAEQILAMAPGSWKLSPLRTIVEAPILRPDGTILDTPGYDPKTKIYYAPSYGMERCKVLSNPTREDAKRAMDYLQFIFSDFPFEGQADRANILALLLTPFVRYAVKDDIQMGLIDANNAGTGKGYLAMVVSIAATGGLPSPISAKRDDTEWAKSILAKLLQAPSIVLIDNIRGVLESATLELLLTGGQFCERILGLSKDAQVVNEATWIATGNNLLIGGDLARRCFRIRLIADTSKPEERDGFKIADLKQWMLDNRPEVVSAILTVARAWYVAGKPKAHNVPNLGSFSNWAKTVGGMLEFAGVQGFQGNRDDLRSKNNEEAAEWGTFLAAWHDAYGETWKLANEIIEPSANEFEPSANSLAEMLPQHLKKALAEKPKSFTVTLSTSLARRVQTVYGVEGYRIEKDQDKHTKASLWRVLRRVAEAKTIQRVDEKTNSTPITNNHIEDERFNHPQPSASLPSDQYPDTQLSSLQSHSTANFANEKTAPSCGGLLPVAEGSKQNELRNLWEQLKALPIVGGHGYTVWTVPGNDYSKGNVSKAEYLTRLMNMVKSGDPLQMQSAEDEMHKRLGEATR